MNRKFEICFVVLLIVAAVLFVGCLVRLPTPNNPPNRPVEPSGPRGYAIGQPYEYSTSAIDPDGDPIKYTFDWCDGTTSETVFIPSGATARAYHSWTTVGTYYVRVQAQDTSGATNWSASHCVSIVTTATPESTLPPTAPPPPTPNAEEQEENKQIMLYGIIGVVVVVCVVIAVKAGGKIAGQAKESMDRKRREKVESERIRREEERRRLEYKRRIKEVKAKYEQYKREGYKPDKNLEEMLK
jgi:hypothetical protein